MEAGHHADTATDGTETLQKVRADAFDLILVDFCFPPTDGVRLLREIKRIQPQTLVVIFTGHADVERVLSSFRGGAFDVLEKPVRGAKLLELAQRACQVREMGRKRQSLAEELETERVNVMKLRQQLALDDPFQKLTGHSPAMQSLVETLREVARAKKGRFELASGGTLFLDEIGEISPATQLLLLRVLQERRFERVGGEQTLEANVRLVSATNRDLSEAVRLGAFRSDLYYRLNVIPVQLPALRERREDIPLLIERFVSQIATRTGRRIDGIEPAAMAALPPILQQNQRLAAMQDTPGTLQDLERVRIIEALREAVGNKKAAARQLGIHRSTLYAKMRRYGLLEECRDAGQPVSDSATRVPSR